MRPKQRPGDRPLLARLVYLSFSLGLLAVFCFTNFNFLSDRIGGKAPEGGAWRGGYGRSLLDPGTDVLPDLAELRGGGEGLIAGMQQQQGGFSSYSSMRALSAGGGAGGGRRGSTLVVYVYNAHDIEHQKNFDYFLRWGIQEGDGVVYKVVIAEGHGVLDLLTLPELPPNAEYIKAGPSCGSVWGALGAALPKLPTAKFDYVMVVDSTVKGPFLPVYAQELLHWTEVFTTRLVGRVKMVGSFISCEGSPKDGNAAGEWRLNPYVMPYAWATDKAGWELLAKDPDIMRCYDSPWDSRYYSDSGASLALLKAGYNLDTLLARYQGVDWWSQTNWGCNERIRPDGEMYYDGVSITPYETLFVPVSLGYVQNGWSFVKTAAKYEEWMGAQAAGTPKVNANTWATDSMSIKAQQLVYMNARGPGCFDFRFYVQHNSDLGHLAADPLELWEHFLLLGQFQGRLHRFSCPVMIGNSYRVAYVKARGRACFDHNYYVTMAPDLKVLPNANELWLHYAGFGQFEHRATRYACADTFRNLTRGFEDVPVKFEEPKPLEGTAAAAVAAAAAAASAGASDSSSSSGTGDGEAGAAAAAAAGGTQEVTSAAGAAAAALQQ